jgi:hypothetical protein
VDSSSTGRNRLLIFLLEFIYSIWQLPTFFRLWAPLAKPSRRFRNFRHSVTTVSRVLAPVQQSYSQSPGTHLQAFLKSLHSMPSQPITDDFPHVDSTSKIDSRTFANICHVTWNKTLHENRLYSRKQSRSEAKPMKKSSHQATLHNSRHYTRMGIAVASAGAPKPNPS